MLRRYCLQIFSQQQSGIYPKSDWRILPFIEHLANGYAPVLSDVGLAFLGNLSPYLWGVSLKTLLREKEQQLLWVHFWLEPVCWSILALVEAAQPLEALAALGPCSCQGGAQALALLQAGLFKVSAAPFLQVVLPHETGGSETIPRLCLGSKYGLNIDLLKTVPYQNAKSAIVQ